MAKKKAAKVATKKVAKKKPSAKKKATKAVKKAAKKKAVKKAAKKKAAKAKKPTKRAQGGQEVRLHGGLQCRRHVNFDLSNTQGFSRARDCCAPRLAQPGSDGAKAGRRSGHGHPAFQSR